MLSSKARYGYIEDVEYDMGFFLITILFIELNIGPSASWPTAGPGYANSWRGWFQIIYSAGFISIFLSACVCMFRTPSLASQCAGTSRCNFTWCSGVLLFSLFAFPIVCCVGSRFQQPSFKELVLRASFS